MQNIQLCYVVMRCLELGLLDSLNYQAVFQILPINCLGDEVTILSPT